jgi:cysteine synthase A
LAREIVDQLGRAPDELVHAVGTGGSAMGTSRGFREAGHEVEVTLAEPAEAPHLTEGRGGEHAIEGVAVTADPPLLDETLYDRAVAVDEDRAHAMARRAAREIGLFAGASTGLNLAAALRCAKQRSPDETVVRLAVDSGLKYLDVALFTDG